MSRRSHGMAALLVAAALTGTADTVLGADCAVADPTGTPLNVRAKPEGEVLSALDNGMTVEILGERALGGKRWAKVAANGAVLGWVFAAYLDCTAIDDTRKSAPMKPRTPPQ